MKITNFSPNDLKAAMYCCAFTPCSECPFHEKDIAGEVPCNPDTDLSKIFPTFAEELAVRVLEHQGNKVIDALILSAITAMYHLD